MSAKLEENLVEQELQRLANRVEDILRMCKRLEQENRLLRSQQEAWALERASLMSRQGQARTQVEAMIGRLKSMEDAL